MHARFREERTSGLWDKFSDAKAKKRMEESCIGSVVALVREMSNPTKRSPIAKLKLRKDSCKTTCTGRWREYKHTHTHTHMAFA